MSNPVTPMNQHKKIAMGMPVDGKRKGGMIKSKKDCGPMMKKGGKVKKGK